MQNTNQKSIILVVVFTTNNIIYTLTNLKGDVLFWTSIGTQKISKTKKVSLITVTTITKLIIYEINMRNYKFIHVKLKGVNKYKKMILKCLKQSFLSILSICDILLLPHNGCKRIKIRRI
uniref:Ribosomal protein S11 n=1 Tax=Schizymenia dubyi TaxID=38368 RepID=A0A0E3DAZ4_9FLOR|nr:ribosomal protein S11 [Schizymenia dubyi]